MKNMYAVFHWYHVDGGFGDPVYTEEMKGIVSATEEEIAEYVRKWDKPIIYEKPYGNLYKHGIRIEKVKMADLTLEPYNPNALPDCRPEDEYDPCANCTRIWETQTCDGCPILETRK